MEHVNAYCTIDFPCTCRIIFCPLTIASIPKASTVAALAQPRQGTVAELTDFNNPARDTVDSHPLLGKVTLYGGAQNMVTGHMLGIKHHKGLQVIEDAVPSGMVTGLIGTGAEPIPLLSYSKDSNGGPPYRVQYRQGGSVVELDNQGGSISVQGGVLVDGKVWVGGYIAQGSLWQAMLWVDGKPVLCGQVNFPDDFRSGFGRHTLWYGDGDYLRLPVQGFLFRSKAP
jgi:hypothetical protein